MTRWQTSPGNPITLMFEPGSFAARIVYEETGIDICYVPVFTDDDGKADAIADRIVHCVNSHDVLLRVMKNLVGMCDPVSDTQLFQLCDAQKMIADAEKETP
jgi:hypothetical protein